MEEFKKIETKENMEDFEIQKILETIKEILKNPNPLGFGNAAKVYTFKDHSFCVKEITNTDRLYSFNDIYDERKIQNKIFDLGIRTPQTLIALETKDNRRFMVMERVNGPSLDDIWNDPSKLLEGFNSNIFWLELESMIKKMHGEGYHHRDLHRGNIMMTIEKGVVVPVIIDFGQSIESFGDEDPYMQKDFPKFGTTFPYTPDINNLKKMKEEITKRLTKDK